MTFFTWHFDTHICWCCGCLCINENCIKWAKLDTPCVLYDRGKRECGSDAKIAKEKYGNCKGRVNEEEGENR